MHGCQRHSRRSAPSGFLDNEVYVSLLAGVSLALTLIATMFSWIAAAVGAIVFLFATARWTWTMRHDFASLLDDADRAEHGETRPER